MTYGAVGRNATSSGNRFRYVSQRRCSAWAWARSGKTREVTPSKQNGGPWVVAVRHGLRVSLRGRLVLRPNHRLAAAPHAFVDELLAGLRV